LGSLDALFVVFANQPASGPAVNLLASPSALLAPRRSLKKGHHELILSE